MTGHAASVTDERRVWLKENALRLADQHRETCPGASCSLSLVALGELIQLAGFELTEDDTRRLM